MGKQKRVSWEDLVDISKGLCNPVKNKTLDGNFVLMWNGHERGIREFTGIASEFRLNEVFFGDGYGYNVLEESKVIELYWKSLTSDAQLIAKKDGDEWILRFVEGRKESFYEVIFDGGAG